MNKDNISLLISICSFFMSMFVLINNFLKERCNIEVIQMFNGDQSGFLKSYDGVRASEKRKTGKPKMEHILLLRIVISNKSSNPVTIISFNLGEDIQYDFSSHTHTEPFYTISNNSNHSVNFGYPDDPLDYLKPSFTLAPYEAKEGYLLFWVSSPDSIKTGQKSKLRIVTSRGDKNIKIVMPTIYESSLDNMYTKKPSIDYR